MPNRKPSIIFVLMILLIVFLLWNAPSNEGPQIPIDEDHGKVERENDCIACHSIEALIKENKKHPPKAECLLCHARA